MTNKVFIAILIFIDMAIATLVSHIMAGTTEVMVGISLLLVSGASFYGVLAILLNSMAGKTVLPMGSPAQNSHSRG